jgi:hypothetical protein
MTSPAEMPDFTRRYPPKDWMDDLGRLLEVAAEIPKKNLVEWVEQLMMEKYPDISNEQERGQMLLDATCYIDWNRKALNEGNVLVLGENKSLISPELMAVLYMILMHMRPGRKLSEVEPAVVIERVEKQRIAWKSEGGRP